MVDVGCRTSTSTSITNVATAKSSKNALVEFFKVLANDKAKKTTETGRAHN
jgi:hypothetical protein